MYKHTHMLVSVHGFSAAVDTGERREEEERGGMGWECECERRSEGNGEGVR